MAKHHDSNNRVAASVLLTLLLTAAPSESLAAERAPRQFDAVIVGAGWAGMKAAQTLLDSGVSSVLVLEANDYVGGRSKAVNSDGSINSPANFGDASNVPIDMGSEWLYSYNDMEDYLLKNGLLNGVELYSGLDGYLHLAEAQFYMQDVRTNGKIITAPIDEEEANELRKRVWEGYLSFRKKQLEKSGKPQSVLSAVEKYKEQLTNNRDIQYLNLITDTGEIDYTGEAGQLNLGDYKWFYEEGCSMDYLAIPGVGYGNVAAAFAAPLMSKIRLGAKVTEINYDDPNNAVISFTKDGRVRKVAAKTVLVTASLGVLKAGTISFVPSLPEWKQDAIDNMGFGVMNKCIMIWNENDAMVWPEDRTWFELITPDDESSGKWTTFFNPTQFKGVPMLVGWIGGAEARKMESQTDEQVLEDVMKNLKAMFPSIRRPDRVVVTRWGQEENVRGTYCFKPVGRDYVKDSSNLRRKAGSVRFAGEATHSVWYGTTFGGWQSGEVEALEMAKEIATLATGPAKDQATTPAKTSAGDSTAKISSFSSSSHVWPPASSALLSILILSLHL